MANDSTAAGYLTPVSPAPPYGEDLERLISRWIRGLTALDTNMVYPRWTDPQATIPVNGTTWCAFGITSVVQDVHPAQVSVDDNIEARWQQESIDIIFCFYGPAGLSIATQFRDGLYLPQNNNALNRVGMSFGEAGRLMAVPELINNQWVRRFDVTVTLRRKTTRNYNIKSFLSAPVQFFGD